MKTRDTNLWQNEDHRLPKIKSGPWQDLYPFKSRYLVRPDGYHLHYLDEGQGAPLVMVHGNPGWSFMFRNLIGQISGFRSLVLDHLGMGLSSRPRPRDYSYRLSDRINDFDFFIKSLALSEPVHLLVHDWGGPIALGWAVKNPKKVKSVSIMNTGLRLPQDFHLPLRLALFRLTGHLGSFLASQTTLFVQGLQSFGTRTPLPLPIREGYLAPYQKAIHREAVGRFVQDIPLKKGHPSWQTLSEISENLGCLNDIPKTLIWGLRDFVFNTHFLADFKLLTPSAQVLSTDGGHFLLEDELVSIKAHLQKFLTMASKTTCPPNFTEGPLTKP